MAISGKGFFMVSTVDGVTHYTRAGEFFFDEDGRLVNSDGFNLMGFQIDANGNPSDLGGISIPGQGYSPPQVSTELSFDINLDSRTASGESYYATQSVYDSLGNAVPLTLTFTKQLADQTWTVAASTTAPNGAVTINGAATGSVVFDEDGIMTTPAGDQPIAITLANGADTPLTISWDLYDALNNSHNDMSGFASPSSTTFQYQNGYAAGVLRAVSVDDDGIVSGTYSNGQLVPLYQIALADFPSYEGLTKLGRNLYVESVSSGQPMPGVPGNGRMGSIAPSAIEMSNVDLAKEFVKMITTQRAFQANSRIITTSDEVLSELINIKR
ncbi:Flagellar hook protein FlgE [Olavius algarvensis Delta 1 endosymbiont]|nr:Flagellar hook protein FlgE [Olavius algarvensis Delta 1 endosymbiont]